MSQIKNNFDVSGNVGAWDIPRLHATNFQSTNPVLNTAYRVLNDGIGSTSQIINLVNNVAGNLFFDTPAALENEIVKRGGPSFNEMAIAAQATPGFALDDALAYAGAKLSQLSKGVRAYEKIRKLLPKDEISNIANKIGNGHAFEKHVIIKKEFPAITQPKEFVNLIEETMRKPDGIRYLERGRVAYWSDKYQAVVTYDPSHKDWGTFFKPDDKKAYFINNKRLR